MRIEPCLGLLVDGFVRVVSAVTVGRSERTVTGFTAHSSAEVQAFAVGCSGENSPIGSRLSQVLITKTVIDAWSAKWARKYFFGVTYLIDEERLVNIVF